MDILKAHCFILDWWLFSVLYPVFWSADLSDCLSLEKVKIMSKNYLYLFLILVLTSSQLLAQKTYKDIKNEPIEFVFGSDEEILAIQKNIQLFIGKDLDAVDVEMFGTGPMLGVTLVKALSNSERPPTYEDLYTDFVEFKKSERYPKVRRSFLANKELEKLVVDYNNWETDKVLLAAIGMPNEEIESFKLFVKENADGNKTYKELYGKL